MFNPEVTIGHILAACTAGLTFLGLVVNWIKQQKDLRKLEADRVRQSAGLVTAKLERWKTLSLHVFEEIQPWIVDADSMLVGGTPVLKVRDFFWKALADTRANLAAKIIDEKIEIAYSDLSGYDPRVQELYGGAVHRLRAIDSSMSAALLRETQAAILRAKGAHRVRSAELGNALRQACEVLASAYELRMEQIVSAFRAELLKVVKAKDGAVVARSIVLRSVEEVYSEISGNEDVESPQIPVERLWERLGIEAKEEFVGTIHAAVCEPGGGLSGARLWRAQRMPELEDTRSICMIRFALRDAAERHDWKDGFAEADWKPSVNVTSHQTPRRFKRLKQPRGRFGTGH